MKILDIKKLPDGKEEFTIDLTEEERKEIKNTYGWKKLTKKRIEKWFLETLKNTIRKEI